MNNSVIVKIFQGIYDLENVKFCLEFRKPFSSLAKIIEGLVGTDFQENIDILVVFENVLESHNIWVI